jgi:ECF transporter S component (folate family)
MIAYVIEKPNWKTRTLVTVSLLVVLSVVLQRFGIMIPLFGFPSFRIDFLHIPLIMVGAFFGPFFGVLAGSCSRCSWTCDNTNGISILWIYA